MTNQTSHNNKQIIQELISKDLTLKGDNLPLLTQVIDKIAWIDNTVVLAELIPQVSVIIGDIKLLSIAASAASVSSIVLFPVGAMLSIINGMEAGLRLYGMRAVAYTITAWTYGDIIPTRSPTVLRNITPGVVKAKAWDIQQRDKAWKAASDSVIHRLNSEIKNKNVKKETLQLIFKALSDNNKQKLTLNVLKGFEKQLSVFELPVWKNNYKIVYPF
ncbi:MAG: hypothetical protein OQK98_09340 [Gammaproteobacteria bacterium]|nr:hypothetical protein [Gammaproteobacteria bacterium]